MKTCKILEVPLPVKFSTVRSQQPGLLGVAACCECYEALGPAQLQQSLDGIDDSFTFLDGDLCAEKRNCLEKYRADSGTAQTRIVHMMSEYPK